MKNKILIPIIAIISMFLLPLASALVLEDFEDISDWDNEWGQLDYYIQSNDSIYGNYSMVIKSLAEPGYGSWAGKVETPILSNDGYPPKNWSKYSGISLWMKRGTIGYGSPFCNPRIRLTISGDNGSDFYSDYILIPNTNWQKYSFNFSSMMSAVRRITIDVDACNKGGMYNLYIDQIKLFVNSNIVSSILLSNNLSANRSQEIAITAKVLDEDGEIVPDGTIINFSTTLGNITSSAKTLNGTAAAILYSEAAGKANITASSENFSIATTAEYIDECLGAEDQGRVSITSLNVQNITNQSVEINFTTNCDVATWLTLSSNLTNNADYSDTPARSYSHYFYINNLLENMSYNLWIGATTDANQPSHWGYGFSCNPRFHCSGEKTECATSCNQYTCWSYCYQVPDCHTDGNCGYGDIQILDSWKNAMKKIGNDNFTTGKSLPVAVVLEDFENISDWNKECGSLYGECDVLKSFIKSNDSAFGNYSMLLSSPAYSGCWAGKLGKYFSSPINLTNYSVFSFYLKKGNQTYSGQDPSIAITLIDSQGNSYIYGSYNTCGGITATKDTWQQFKFSLPKTLSDISHIQIDLYGTGVFSPRDLFIDQVEIRQNKQPILNYTSNKSLDVTQNLSFIISATDPDNDSLIYSVENLPDGAAFNQTTGQFNWIPAINQSSNYQINFSASDGRLITSEIVDINVNPLNYKTFPDKIVLDDFESISYWKKGCGTLYGQCDIIKSFAKSNDSATENYSMSISSSSYSGCWAGKLGKYFSSPINLTNYSVFSFYLKKGNSSYGSYNPSIAITLLDDKNNSYVYGSYTACGGITISNNQWQQYKYDMPTTLQNIASIHIDLYSSGWGSTSPADLLIDQLELQKKPECLTNWTASYTGWGACMANDTKTRIKYYYDLNNCNQTNPYSNTTETSGCDSCAPNWILNNTWGECIDGTQYQNYYDSNNCGETPSEQETQECSVNNPVNEANSTNPVNNTNNITVQAKNSICVSKCGGDYPYWQGQIWIEPMDSAGYAKRWSLGEGCANPIGINAYYGPTNANNLKYNDPYWTYWTMFCSDKEDSYKLCTSCGSGYNNDGGAIWIESSPGARNRIYGENCAGVEQGYGGSSTKTDNWMHVCSKNNDAAFCSKSCGGDYPTWSGQIWLETGSNQWPKNIILGNGCSGTQQWRADNWIMLCGKN